MRVRGLHMLPERDNTGSQGHGALGGCSNLQPQAAHAASAAAAVCGRRGRGADWAVPAPTQCSGPFRQLVLPSGRGCSSRARQAGRGVRAVTGARRACSTHRRRPRRPPFRRVESVGMGVTSSAAGGGAGRRVVSEQLEGHAMLKAGTTRNGKPARCVPAHQCGQS